MIFAFNDSGDGYYQIDIPEGAPMPIWTEGFTPCEIHPVIIQQKTVAEKLAALDAANALTQRNLRESVMLMSEAFKQITGGAVNLTAIPGVAKVYEVEAQAAALRAQL